MNSLKRLSALLCTAAILSTTFNTLELQPVSAAITSGDVSIVVVPNTVEYRKDDYSYLSVYGSGEQKLSLFAARNERESGQIMLYCPHDISSITITMSDLINTENSEKTVPSENTEVCFEQYVKTRDNEYWLQDMTGYHADPLLPQDVASNSLVNLNRLDTTLGNNQGLWVTVTVPDDTDAGVYTGNCILTLDGREAKVPVELTVYDFTLSDQTYFKTHFNDFHSSTGAVYHDLAGYDKEWKDTAQSNAYAADLNAFLNVRKHSSGYPDADVPWSVSGASTQAQMDAYAEAVYQYVTTSKAPYYRLDPGFMEKRRESLLDDFDFSLTDDYSTLVDDESAVSSAINKKSSAIIRIYEERFGRELTDDEIYAIQFAVKTYLYYDVMYYTHTLPDYLKRYISDANDNKDYFRERYENGNVRLEDLSLPTDWVDRFYDGLMLSNDTSALMLARPLSNVVRYCQYDWLSDDGLHKFGLETVLKALADKSLETGTDLFKYAYMYCPRIDECQPTDFWRTYSALAASRVIENSKQAVREYLCSRDDCEPGLKARLMESLDNICYLVTDSPVNEPRTSYTNGMFTKRDAKAYYSILNNGLQHHDLGFFSQDYYSFLAYHDGYGHCEATPDTLVIPPDYSVNSFCPLFNDFSATTTPYCAWEAVAKDYQAVQEALNDPNIHLWWYSCNMSNGNPALASHYIGGNIHHATSYFPTEINGNSLAIDRVNKWQQYKLGIEGELLWAVDQYMLDGIPNTDVWTEPAKGGSIEGILVYPTYSLIVHTLKRSDADARALFDAGMERFASSIRLENLSEAADDYDYLQYANELINKGNIINLDVRNYAEKIDAIYNTLFDDVDYDESVTPEAIMKAKKDLAQIILRLQEKIHAKAVSFEIQTGNETLFVRWKNAKAQNKDLTEMIALDFQNCRSSVGTMTKIQTPYGEGYEIIIPIDDLPMINTSATATRYGGEELYKLHDGEFTTSNLPIGRFSPNGPVDVVQPLRQYDYLKSRFWTHAFDHSIEDWKNSGQAISFEFKPIDLKADTERDMNSAYFYFNETTNWKGTTKQYKLDLTDNTVKIGNTKLQAIKGNDGWCRLTVPFALLEPDSEEALAYPIDMFAFTWIKHSIAIRNIKLTDMNAMGDLNGDGAVDIRDSRNLQEFLRGINSAPDFDWSVADLDGSGEINAKDQTLLKRRILEQ